jgi:hypothetical protein
VQQVKCPALKLVALLLLNIGRKEATMNFKPVL